jgi:hypothetical protein
MMSAIAKVSRRSTVAFMKPHRALRGLVMPVLVAVTATACAGGGQATTTTRAEAPTTTSSITTTTTSPRTTTTSTTTAATSTTTLAGEPIDFGPREGDVLAVIGVRYDDVLNVRAGPGIDQPIVATLEPTSNRAVATGRTRALPRSFWTELEVNGVTGWASLAFLAYLGLTDDITATVVEALGEIPTADTMLELGRIAAETQASVEPRSVLVVVVAPTVGDLGEVTYDVIGLGDDALRGLRLHVFGQPLEDGEGFSLMAVEATSLCGRGVTADGLCP